MKKYSGNEVEQGHKIGAALPLRDPKKYVVKFEGPNGRVSKRPTPPFLKSWLTSDNWKEMGASKMGLLTASDEVFISNYAEYFTPYFRILGRHMNAIRVMLGKGKATHNEFIEILNRAKSVLPEETGVEKIRKRTYEDIFEEPSDLVLIKDADLGILRLATVSNEPKTKRRAIGESEGSGKKRARK